MATTASSTPSGPVGIHGARVDIAQRPAAALSGWLGVVVLAACVAGLVIAGQHGSSLIWIPIVVFVVVAHLARRRASRHDLGRPVLRALRGHRE